MIKKGTFEGRIRRVGIRGWENGEDMRRLERRSGG